MVLVLRPYDRIRANPQWFFHNEPLSTLPARAPGASPCPSAIGFASGHCRVGLAGGRAYVAGGSNSFQ